MTCCTEGGNVAEEEASGAGGSVSFLQLEQRVDGC